MAALTRRPLPNRVAHGLRLLICGVNPSPASAAAGVGYARPGNRFWPAALAAGVVTADRDGNHALKVDRVGFTDFVGRVEADASKMSSNELRQGRLEVEALVREYKPAAVLFTSITAYRVAVSRKAGVGVQPEPFGGRPAYVMPSTSGRNAATSLTTLTDHFRAAATLADTADAARANARWCASHGGIRGGWTDTYWYAPRRTAEFYPDAVTLHPAVDADEMLARVDLSTGASVKDSFGALDLAPHGFDVLFDAVWVRTAARNDKGEFDWFTGDELEAALAAGGQAIAPLRIWSKT
ncbi:MAG: double-stranded uracil-DNA glycosylase [Actinomycetota bacterium]